MNTSLSFDRRLWPYDVAQSRAHSRMLAACGIVSTADRDELLSGLDAVEAELTGGSFPFRDDDEDIHMAVERRLTELAGPVGGRLPPARVLLDVPARPQALRPRPRGVRAPPARGGRPRRRELSDRPRPRRP